MPKGPSLEQQAKLAQLRIEASKEPDLLTTKQFAKRINVHPETIRKWKRMGYGPRAYPITFGEKPRIRYRLAEIMLWEQEIQGQAIEKTIRQRTRQKWDELMEQEAQAEQQALKEKLVDAAIGEMGEDLVAQANREGVGPRIGDSVIDAAREALAALQKERREMVKGRTYLR